MIGNIIYLSTKRKKIEKIINEISRQEIDHPFRPKLNQKRETYRQPQINVVNDFLVKNFVVRQESARKEKEFVNLIKTEGVKIKGVLHRSASAENSIVMRRPSKYMNAIRTLHHDLNNISVL